VDHNRIGHISTGWHSTLSLTSNATGTIFQPPPPPSSPRQPGDDAREPWCAAQCPHIDRSPAHSPDVAFQASELDQKIQDVYRRIQTERKVLEGTTLLRQATTNQDVLRRTDAQIREAERSLSYFEDTLRELQNRKAQLAQGADPARFGSPPSAHPGLPTSPRSSQPGHRSTRSQGGFDPSAAGADAASPPAADSDAWGTKSKQYSSLDLIKADTPHTSAKISKMLHQLEFKLTVEKKYKFGIDKMSKLYQAEGDKKSRLDAEAKRIESDKKIQLLQTALKRYKTLHVLDVADDDDEGGPCANLSLSAYTPNKMS
jgi:hypothetical protein